MKRLLPFLLLLCSACWANTPPTWVNFVKSSNTSSVASIASPSASWNSGDYIVSACVGAGSTSYTWSTPAATGLTFTIQIHLDGSTSFAPLQISTALAGSASSGTVTCATGGVGDFINSYVWVIRNATGIGNKNSLSGSSSVTTISLSAAQADSAILWVVTDWSAGAATRTGTPTPTHSDAKVLISGQATQYAFDLMDQPSTGSVSYGVSGSTANNLSFGAIEIKGTAGGGPTPVCTIALMGAGPC